ncbi:MAG: TIGR00341 family protein [Halothiobacillus sp.]|jgi:uncharacterized hydrophobic protein (TIGR00341 family)|nr:TIGR00341 family protein [Halothiobacillus sp.]
MALKVVEIVAPSNEKSTIAQIAEDQGVIDWWRSAAFEDERFSTQYMVAPGNFQSLLDKLQKVLDRCPQARIIIHDIDATLPKFEQEEQTQTTKSGKKNGGKEPSLTREELYEQVETGGRITSTYLLLTGLSTIVAALGMIDNNAAVVIGAMVIAPLLGPNLALALGTTLGDLQLARRAIAAALAGLGLAILVAWCMAWLLEPSSSVQLITRTDVNFSALILALASGAAAVLSLTTGAAIGLVGVMVAVALMPPAAALGLFLGWGDWSHAYEAGLLLAINIAAINLSAKLVFVLKGISPRRWPEKSRAKRSSRWSFIFWGLSVGALTVLIFLSRS